MRGIRTRTCLGVASCLLFGLLSAAPAQASFHLTKIREIGQGGGGVPDYVELQMFAPGQNLVGGKFIQTYNQLGMVQNTFTFPSDVPFSDNQRTIYVARNDAPPLGTRFRHPQSRPDQRRRGLLRHSLRARAGN